MKLFDQQDEFEKLMKENNNEIKAINDKIDMLKVKEKTVENIISNHKICSFFNKGYCSSNEICPFYHPKEICEIYLSNGVCRKLVCKYRHPKDCRYWKRNKSCYRGSTCVYVHRDLFDHEPTNRAEKWSQPCFRCNKSSEDNYYCEFCHNDFCSKCTKEEAHLSDAHKQDASNLGCKDLHQPMIRKMA